MGLFDWHSLIAPTFIRQCRAMIPPITDVLIAEATQTSGMMAAGQAYWLNGRVRGLEIDPAMALIVAEVQGSARDPYEVTIAFSDDGADPPEPFVECTCPVGFDCMD